MKKKADFCYSSVAFKGRYDLAVANAINTQLFSYNLTTADFLHSNKKIVSACNLGCCLNFSLYLMVKLKENGIRSILISVPETIGQKACVAYEDGGTWYVADIVEDIKFFTNLENEYAEENDTLPVFMPDMRKKYSNNSTAHSAIPLLEFKAQNEYVTMYADIFSFKGKMSEFLKTGHRI